MLARVESASVTAPGGLRSTRGIGDRVGDRLLYGLTALASLIAVLIVAAIAWRVADGAWPAIEAFHLSFLWHNEWNPVTSKFGARDLIVGTVVTSFGAVVLAAPLSVAIGLFLSELAPPNDVTTVDRKSTRLNSSHRCISYAVFCLKKKKK